MLVSQREGISFKKAEGRFKVSGKTMIVRVLGKDRDEPYGEIVHFNLAKPVPYQNLSELVLRIDGIADFLGLMETDSPCRLMGSGPGGERGGLPAEYRRIVPMERWEEREPRRELSFRKAQETVCVELLGRYHESMQGRIRGRVTGDEYVYFRSALELMMIFSKI